MRTFNSLIKILVSIGLVVTMAACSDDKGGNRASIRDRSGGGFNGNNQPGSFDPRNNNQGLGEIYSSNLTGAAHDLAGPGELQGNVRGITFQGRVGANAQWGNVTLAIFDDEAQYSGEYEIPLVLNPQRSRLQERDTILHFEDDFGAVIFYGDFDQNGFRGVVRYQNFGDSEKQLGSFETGRCNFVEC